MDPMTAQLAIFILAHFLFVPPLAALLLRRKTAQEAPKARREPALIPAAAFA